MLYNGWGGGRRRNGCHRSTLTLTKMPDIATVQREAESSTPHCVIGAHAGAHEQSTGWKTLTSIRFRMRVWDG